MTNIILTLMRPGYRAVNNISRLVSEFFLSKFILQTAELFILKKSKQAGAELGHAQGFLNIWFGRIKWADLVL